MTDRGLEERRLLAAAEIAARVAAVETRRRTLEQVLDQILDQIHAAGFELGIERLDANTFERTLRRVLVEMRSDA